MLKLLCPNCYKSVSVPESAAGTETPCPECQAPFPVPAKYTPAVGAEPVAARPAPPPAPPAPEPAPVPTLVPAPAVDWLPHGYTRSRGITISPNVVAWIPAVSLAAILVMTFLPWVELTSRGHPVYTQGAWRSITGRPTRDIQLEDLMLKELPPPSLYDRTAADWYIMLPYLFAVFAAVAVAWADRLESAAVEKRMAGLWPFRHTVLASLAGAALLLLAIEATRGFGLERALNAAVSEKFAEQREKAGNVAGEQKKIDFYESQELAKYGLERTTWLTLVMLLHAVVLLAMLARIGLARRGDKPPPRLVLQY